MSVGADPVEQAAAAELAAGAKELVTLARQIEAWRTGRRVSLSRLVRDYPEVGSDRTYNKLLAGDTSQLNVERHLHNYRAAARRIDEARARTGREPLLRELRNAEEVRLAVAELHQVEGHDRLVVIEGGTGTGKSTCLKILGELYPAHHHVEATVAWRTLTSALSDMALAVGMESRRDALPRGGAALLNGIISTLGDKRALVLIDEGQHMTPEVLNTLKTLLNKTRAMFVVAAIDTLWRKLQAAAWQEAKQLVFNRMHCRVVLQPPGQEDVAVYVRARTGLELGESELRVLTAAAHDNGALSFVRRVCNDVASQGNDPAALKAAVEQARRDILGRR